MRTAVASLKSCAVLSWSRNYRREFPKEEKEGPDAYEQRTWPHRFHVADTGKCCIPSTAFKNCLSEAAKYLSIQIPGKGKATYTKHFESGVLVPDGLVLPIGPTELKEQWLHVPADGKRGGSRRVWKCFPTVAEWKGNVTFLILDETITEEVFKYVLEQAGSFIGIGFFRPRNNGFYGRFTVEKLTWS